MENWFGWGGKETRTNIQILAEPGIEPGILWLEGSLVTRKFKKINIKEKF